MDTKKQALGLSGGGDIDQAELALVRAHYDALMGSAAKSQGK
jgi:hypothetical protein